MVPRIWDSVHKNFLKQVAIAFMDRKCFPLAITLLAITANNYVVAIVWYSHNTLYSVLTSDAIIDGY